MTLFIETKVFTRLVREYLSDDEYGELQKHLVAAPDAGDVIAGTGGVRKLRWRGSGKGKRGGFRVIYFAKMEEGRIWMLTMYPKNVRDNIQADVLKKIREEVEKNG
ncbi:MAG: type II toxin-antitoxin system RelE/ParE family toxin [Gemmataceae bacterium]